MITHQDGDVLCWLNVPRRCGQVERHNILGEFLLELDKAHAHHETTTHATSVPRERGLRKGLCVGVDGCWPGTRGLLALADLVQQGSN